MSAKATWMSGGSGSGVYDPVTTADNTVQFNGQDDGWLNFKGGRKFNFGTYRNTGLKGLCDGIRNRSRPKCLLSVFAAVVFLIFIIMILVLVSSRHSHDDAKPGFEKWVNKSEGLNFLPVGHEDTVFLPFSLRNDKEDTYLGYTNGLDAAIEPYKTIYIHNGNHLMCNSSYAPGDAVCQQPITVFGDSCVHVYRYGYRAGQPCILLYFTLPLNYTVRSLLPKDGQAYLDAEKVLRKRFSMEHVGISCEPSTAEDKKYFGDSSSVWDAVEYHPSQGFPNYFFRPRTVDKFIPPAVMVQFRTLRDSLKEPHMVRFTCTAWGKAFNPQGHAINDKMFTASFVFRIY